MADQTVRISNLPDSGSPEAVAYRLVERIAYAEAGAQKTQDRAYYLALYAECLSVTRGASYKIENFS